MMCSKAGVPYDNVHVSTNLLKYDSALLQPVNSISYFIFYPTLKSLVSNMKGCEVHEHEEKNANSFRHT